MNDTDMENRAEEKEEPKNDKSLSQSDVNCGVCYELLILPTTLRCGHNFCRHCLAKWYFASKKTECPICRQVYQEKPAVNNLVRCVYLFMSSLCLTAMIYFVCSQKNNALKKNMYSKYIQLILYYPIRDQL